MSNVHINTTLDADTAKILAGEFGWEVEDVAVSEEQTIAEARGEEAGRRAEADGRRPHRPPVVTVMGHVDHGKTSLLDSIRKANVAEGEAGGITQHIGAYQVETTRGTIVFLDTPGHEAFTQMRARGAERDRHRHPRRRGRRRRHAADQGGHRARQGGEGAHHRRGQQDRQAGRRPRARQARARRARASSPEEWGGDTLFVNVSAVTGEGIDKLLEAVPLQSELLELKANPKRPASGTVLEALLDRGRGPVARVLVQDGTLRVGDFVLAGAGFGKVRAMTNEHGKQVQEAGPATPVEILGLNEVPNAGDRMDAVKDAKKAQEIAESRKGKMAQEPHPGRRARLARGPRPKRIAESDQQELRVIIKGDVQGSVEALADALAKLSGEKVRLVDHPRRASARITEGDVNLAIASKAIIVGFNVRPAGKAASLAEENKIEIRLYSIIYNALEDVKAAMEGLLPPTLVEKQQRQGRGPADLQGQGGRRRRLHGDRGQDRPQRQDARLIRDGVVVWDGKIASLKRFKDDVERGRRGLRVRHQPRGLQRHEGEGHPRVLRGRGDQAEALIGASE